MEPHLENSPERLPPPNFSSFFRYFLVAEEITFKGVQFSCPMGAVLNEGGDRCGKGIKKGSKVNFIRVYPIAHNIQ